MKQYVKLADNEFVIARTFSDIPQEGMVEFDEPIGTAPTPWSRFSVITKEWVESKPVENVKADIAEERNKLLQNSDWTQLPNNPLTPDQQTAWATYRQALRDIPSQSGYPFDVIWPTPPA